jgi:hypothetical protein
MPKEDPSLNFNDFGMPKEDLLLNFIDLGSKFQEFSRLAWPMA